MKNAVLYIRVSTDEQAKYGYSIDMQQNQCFNFAEKEGYKVIGTYIDDGYTARNPNRPQYKKLFELDGVEVEFSDEAISAIAHKAVERKTGARGLRSILESSVMDVMYETPSDETITKCEITEEVIEGTGEAVITHKDSSK